jgi:hypothetical protein
VNVTSFPIASLSVTLASLPAGVHFMDNGDGTATLSGTPLFPQNALGAYTLNITASNGVSSATQVFTLIVADPPLVTSSASTTFTVGKAGSFKVATSAGVPAATTLKETGKLPAGVTFMAARGVLSGTPLAGAAGTYPFTITASNASGSTVQNFTLTVDQAPVFKSAASATFILGQPGTSLVKTIGTLPETLSTLAALPTTLGNFHLSDNGDGTATLTGTPTATGTIQFTITASNTVVNNTIAGGAVSSSPTTKQLFTLKVIAGFTSANTASITVGTAGSFTVTPSLPGTLTMTGKRPSLVTFDPSTGLLSGAPAAGSGGKYVLTFTDVSGAARATQTFTLLVNEPPAFTGASDATFTVGSASSVTIRTTGFPLATLSESGVLPLGLTFKNNGNGTATLSGTPKANMGGTYILNLTAHNGVGSDATEPFTITVKQPPAFTSPAAVSFIEGKPSSFTITTTGFPLTTFLPIALPGWLHLTDNRDGTALLSGTPPAAGTFSLILKATNGTTVVSHALTVKVAAGAAPQIITGNAANFGELEPGIFTIKTTGFPAAILSVSGAVPAGVTFKDNGNGTATLSGRPAALTAKDYPLTVTAHNAAGADATQTFTLTVHQAITTNSATFTVGASTPFVITTSGAATLGLVGKLPTGVTFSAATHTLRGKPAAGTGHTYTFTIVATTPTFRSARTFTLTVEQPPKILTPKIPTFIVGKFNTFTVKTTGFPTPTFNVTGLLPNSGLTWHDNGNGTATISGIPEAGTAGKTSFTIMATNDILAAATQLFSLTIDQPPLIATPSTAIDLTNHLRLAIPFPISAAGVPGATLNVIGALPAGIAIRRSAGTLTLSGTPSVPGKLPRTFAIVIAAGAGTMPKSFQTFSIVVN